MRSEQGISAVIMLCLAVPAAALLLSLPVWAQADPVTLLESFPTDGRPEIVASVDGRTIYADHLTGSLYGTDGKPGAAVQIQGAGKLLLSIKAAYAIYEKSPAYIAADNDLQGWLPYDPAEEAFLWKSDGTPEGTVLLRREPASRYLFVGPLGEGMLYAKLGEKSLELWITDGTPEGTVLVKKLSSSGHYFSWRLAGTANKDGRCYFGLSVSSSIFPTDQLSAPFVTDGTTEGTMQLAEWVASYPSEPASRLFLLDGRPLFLCSGIYHSPLLGTYADTAYGTWLVALGTTPETTPWPAAVPFLSYDNYFGAVELANGKVFFLAAGVSTGRDVCFSDGTVAGTQSLTRVRPDLNFSSDVITDPVVLGDAVYFGGYEAATGYGLWRSDGTTDGTVLVKAMNNPVSGEQSGFIDHLQVSGSLLYFRNSYLTPTLDALRVLWRSDGTAEGTLPVGEVYMPLNVYSPEFHASNDFQSFDLDGVLYYFAKDADHGMELWRSSGTPETTFLCEDIVAGSGDTQLSTPALVGRNVVFTGLNPAKDGESGIGLWSMPHPFSIVPDLIGTPAEQALNELERVNLASGTVEAQHDAFIPKDSIVSQSLAAGMRVLRDTAVGLVVSLGPEVIPEGEGETQVEGEPPAEGEVQQEGETPAEGEVQQEGETPPEGETQLEGEPPVEGETQVEGESPAEGETQPVEGEAEGEPAQEGEVVPATAPVPDLSGMDETDVSAALAAAGFVPGAFAQAYSDTVPMGTVISQEPPAGAQAAAGSAVNLVVSMGPEPQGCLQRAVRPGGWVRNLGELLFPFLAVLLMGAFDELF